MTIRESAKLRKIEDKIDKHIVEQNNIAGKMNESLKSLDRAIRGESENGALGIIDTLKEMRGEFRADILTLQIRVGEMEKTNERQDIAIKAKSELKDTKRNGWERFMKTARDIYFIASILFIAWMIVRRAIDWTALIQPN